MTSSSNTTLWPTVGEVPVYKVREGHQVQTFTSIPTVSRSDYDNLKENMRALELRMARLEDKFGKALKEHEETVEVLLKVIKDAT